MGVTPIRVETSDALNIVLDDTNFIMLNGESVAQAYYCQGHDQDMHQGQNPSLAKMICIKI